MSRGEVPTHAPQLALGPGFVFRVSVSTSACKLTTREILDSVLGEKRKTGSHTTPCLSPFLCSSVSCNPLVYLQAGYCHLYPFLSVKARLRGRGGVSLAIRFIFCGNLLFSIRVF